MIATPDLVVYVGIVPSPPTPQYIELYIGTQLYSYHQVPFEILKYVALRLFPVWALLLVARKDYEPLMVGHLGGLGCRSSCRFSIESLLETSGTCRGESHRL